MHIRRKKTQVATIILLLAILALLTSTTTYMVVTFVSNEASRLDALLSSAGNIWIYDPEPDFPDSAWDLEKDYTWLYQRTGTATVMINVRLPVMYLSCVIRTDPILPNRSFWGIPSYGGGCGSSGPEIVLYRLFARLSYWRLSVSSLNHSLLIRCIQAQTSYSHPLRSSRGSRRYLG